MTIDSRSERFEPISFWHLSHVRRGWLRELGRYAIAIASVALATYGLISIEPIAGSAHLFTTYIFAILFTAWYCGTGPALVCMVLNLLAAAYFFLYPIQSIEIYGFEAQFGAALYLVVGMSSIMFTQSMRSAHRQAKLSAELTLKKQQSLQTEIEKREQAQLENLQLLRRFVRVQEEERSRISRELHDQCGQDVTALYLGLKFLEQTIDNPRLSGQFRELNHSLDRLSREIHDLAFELRPPSLDELGLKTAVESYLTTWSSRFRITADLECRGLNHQMISSDVSTAVYRVVQESLTNVAKHSCTERVSVVLDCTGSVLTAIIEDQGVGFVHQEKLAGHSNRMMLGLLGMRERLEAVGGELQIESIPNGGTTVFARVPIFSRVH